jgi:hypothetical protein
MRQEMLNSWEHENEIKTWKWTFGQNLLEGRHSKSAGVKKVGSLIYKWHDAW